ncbi:hypothetical protein [Amycolatopsis alkalitolerans]|uniref:ESX secretion-associated protein EspG n=1 Tax=Amycolatopsis alkalitolerans TaxID=2547244 RepID=A0A5C4M5X1_9PSEU|nr:hypothetical protein [Amycolatopsis alkalitolerans]TNC26031.1 hypothetical protein FG385_12685 [Amycolatopsis alkalitolerans]
MDTNAKPGPRAADVAEARRLFDAAEQNGLAPLPDLLATELCVLGAPAHSLFDEAIVRAWAELPEAAREELVVNALNGLHQRRLLDPPADPDDPTLRMHAPLATIVTGRAHPSFLAVCTAECASQDAPRMYGVAEQGRGIRVVLVERPSTNRLNPHTGDVEELAPEEDGNLNQIYQYLLVSPGEAVRALGAWLHSDAEYRVEFFHNPEVGKFRRDTIRGREILSLDDGAVMTKMRNLIESGVTT